MATPTLDTLVVIRPGDSVDTDLLFELACRKNPHGKIEQDANGDVLIMAPTGGESSKQNLVIGSQLYTWAQRERRGEAFESHALFILPDGSKRSPNAAWVRYEKLREVPLEERRQFLKVVPDFVIELLSPSDRYKAVQRKMAEYRQNGVSLGWLINPKKREVMIYRESGVEVLEDPEEVHGEGLLAGFVLKMAEIWKGLDF